MRNNTRKNEGGRKVQIYQIIDNQKELTDLLTATQAIRERTDRLDNAVLRLKQTYKRRTLCVEQTAQTTLKQE